MSIEIKVQNHIFVFLLDPTLRNTIMYRKSSKDKLDFLFREVRGECNYNIGKERNKEFFCKRCKNTGFCKQAVFFSSISRSHLHIMV